MMRLVKSSRRLKKQVRDNTIIIFNSDHGDYMGAFSLLLLKGPFGHDSVNRVPFYLGGARWRMQRHKRYTCGLIGYCANNSGALRRETLLRYAGTVIFEPD